MMYFHPGSVDLSRLPQEGQLDMMKDGVDGSDPRGGNSSEQFARKALDVLIRNAVPRIMELLREKSS